MSKAIGPSFGAEIALAGLNGLPFSWTNDGLLTFDASMTPNQVQAVEAVYAAHDPKAPTPPPAPIPDPLAPLQQQIVNLTTRLNAVQAAVAALQNAQQPPPVP